MAGTVDRKKLASWRQRLERFAGSGLSVYRFCAAEGVSTASFYRWRKVLAAERSDGQPVSCGAEARQAFAPVTLVGVSPLVGELPGGTRLQMPTGDVGLVRAAIAEIAAADARWSTGGESC